MTSTTDPHRILFLFRDCSLEGMARAFMDRATTVVGCQSKPVSPKWKHPVYSRSTHYQIARDLHAGKYDLVVTLSDPEYRWRHDVSLLHNLYTHVKKTVRTPSCFGIQRLTEEAAKASIPIVVYDDEDNQELARKNWPLLDLAAVYFKAHTPANPYHCFLFQDRRTESIWNVFKKPEFQERVAKIAPMSAGFEAPSYAEECLAPEKKTDVFFSGGVDYSIPRKEGKEMLLRLRDEGINVDIPEERLDHRSFLRRMSEAWLTLSPEGGSPDSFRFYEAPMVKTVPLINNIGHRRHFPHRNEQHCLYYHVEGDDLMHRIRWALERKELLKKIAQQAHDFVMAHHQYHQLVDFMIARGLEAAKLARLEE